MEPSGKERRLKPRFGASLPCSVALAEEERDLLFPNEKLDCRTRDLSESGVGLVAGSIYLGYTCIVDDLVATQDRAAARVTFKGIHKGRFFDTDATGREITWAGAAFFRTDGDRIIELWVLGDIDGVKRQLGAPAGASFSSS